MLRSIVTLVGIFLLSWLGVGCGLVYLWNIVRFQRPFSRTLVQEGVYDQTTHRRCLRTAWIGGLTTLLASAGLTAFLDLRAGLMGLVMTVLGILVGLFRSRHMLLQPVNNVCRYLRTHLVYMDRKKAAAFLKREYGLDLYRLAQRE